MAIKIGLPAVQEFHFGSRLESTYMSQDSLPGQVELYNHIIFNRLGNAVIRKYTV